MTPEDRKYVRYISEHRNRVQKAWNLLKTMFPEVSFVKDSRIASRIQELISIHDMSKYKNEEFEAYRRHWYPAAGEAPDEEAYQAAWEHHYQNNPHHYLYWKDKEFITKENYPYLVEMICDWLSVSGITGGDPSYLWFQRNKEEIATCLPHSAVTFLDTILREVYDKTGR